MASQATATLDADTEACGPILVAQGKRGSVHVEITGTITVAVQRRMMGSGWVTVDEAGSPAEFTESFSKALEAPGEYQLIASGTSGGSAVCRLWAHR